MDRRSLLALLGSTATVGCAGRQSETESATPIPTGSQRPTDSPTGTASETATASDTATASETATASDTATDSQTPSEPNQTPCDSQTAQSSTRTATGDVLRRLRIRSVDETPKEYDLDLKVSMIQPAITTEHTAVLRVRLENTGTKSKVVQVGSRPPFSAYESNSAPPGLALFAPYSAPGPTGSGCWDIPTDDVIQPLDIHTTELDPCDRDTGNFVLRNHPKNESCLPRGTYRFDSQYKIGPFAEDDRPSFWWGFEVEVL